MWDVLFCSKASMFMLYDAALELEGNDSVSPSLSVKNFDHVSNVIQSMPHDLPNHSVFSSRSFGLDRKASSEKV